MRFNIDTLVQKVTRHINHWLDLTAHCLTRSLFNFSDVFVNICVFSSFSFVWSILEPWLYNSCVNQVERKSQLHWNYNDFIDINVVSIFFITQLRNSVIDFYQQSCSSIICIKENTLQTHHSKKHEMFSMNIKKNILLINVIRYKKRKILKKREYLFKNLCRYYYSWLDLNESGKRILK